MTALEICNMALGLLGQEAITSGQLATPTNKASRQCLMHYAAARKHIISKRAWSFASKWAEVEKHTAANAAGYETDGGRIFLESKDPGCPYQYMLDALDSLRVIACTDGSGNPETDRGTSEVPTIVGPTTQQALSYPLVITAVGSATGQPGDEVTLSCADENAPPLTTPANYGDVLVVSLNGTLTEATAAYVRLDSYEAGTILAGGLGGDLSSGPISLYNWGTATAGAAKCLVLGRDADSVRVLYAFDPAVASIPEDVCNVIAHELASRMAVALTENLKLRSELLALGKQYYLEAASLDGSQMSPIPVRVQPANSILYKRRA